MRWLHFHVAHLKLRLVLGEIQQFGRNSCHALWEVGIETGLVSGQGLQLELV